MMITIDVKTALVYLLLVAAIVLVGYLIVVAKNLVKTVKEVNKILEDAAVVSSVTAEKASQLDGIVGDVCSAVSDISQAVKGEQSAIGAVSNLAKSAGSLVAIFKSGKPKKNTKKKNINKI